MKLKKQVKKGGSVTDILLQADLIFDKYNETFKIDKPTVNNTSISNPKIEEPDTLYNIILLLLSQVDNYNTNNIKDFLEKINNNPNYKIMIDPSNSGKFKYKDGDFQDNSTFFDDTTNIFSNFTTERNARTEPDNSKKNNTHINFQSNKFPVNIIINDNKTEAIEYRDLFAKYKIFTHEDEQHFVTIDPEIIQIMVFENDKELITNDDIVYSFKLIYRDPSTLTLRYTTQLFPNNSKINESTYNLDNFNTFNKTLGNNDIATNYDLQLFSFLKKYIRFYNFYKKCYIIGQENEKNTLVDYQLKYISILGKARFSDPIIQVRTAVVTDYIMSNLLFVSPSYAFISGGYKGFKDNKYGVTRSGYEISKRYNRPILTIMCAEGLKDSHEYSDSTLIYGEHWGEDSIALSQLTDGAIIIAPFGGWTYIECLTLLANKKIVGIYNDFFNILNYNQELSTNENENSNFFKFTDTEQNNIINYNINYYLILLFLIKDDDVYIKDKNIFNKCLELGVKLLTYLKRFLKQAKNLYEPVKKAESANNYGGDILKLPELMIKYKNKIDEAKTTFASSKLIKHIIKIIDYFNNFKKHINKQINDNLNKINIKYKNIIHNADYQNEIPENCDGIWIKPSFDLFGTFVEDKNPNNKDNTIINGGRKHNKKGGTCIINSSDEDDVIINKELEFITVKPITDNNPIFTNLNNNIIFVFSDVMYLNLYLNTNLNTNFYQTKIQNKITKLLKLHFTIQKNDSNIDTTIMQTIEEEKDLELVLSRKIDGVLDEETKTIINDVKTRKDYTFKINNICIDYKSLIKEEKPLLTNNDKTLTFNEEYFNILKKKYDNLELEEEFKNFTIAESKIRKVSRSLSDKDLLKKVVKQNNPFIRAQSLRALENGELTRRIIIAGGNKSKRYK